MRVAGTGWLVMVAFGVATAVASAAMYQDFEGGTGGFTSDNGAVSLSQTTETAVSGSGSLKLASTGIYGEAWVSMTTWTAFTWADGPLVQVSVKAAVANTGGTPLYMNYVDSSGNWAIAGGAVDYFLLPNDTAWHTILLDASSFNTTGTSWGMMLFTNSINAGTFYLDAIQIVPEPVTLTLLAMGGAAMLRRRM